MVIFLNLLDKFSLRIAEYIHIHCVHKCTHATHAYLLHNVVVLIVTSRNDTSQFSKNVIMLFWYIQKLFLMRKCVYIQNSNTSASGSNHKTTLVNIFSVHFFHIFFDFYLFLMGKITAFFIITFISQSDWFYYFIYILINQFLKGSMPLQ